ncbi:SDR family NAD(P)-dependent oxidoreductase [Actinomadura sp. SCN-SB]|uniref:SDR family NAD(P)-dependent oxidoreductase n=1 Tax=Actinomadura sp. SCN-SB TaxID=3373092 RepID=UPI00375385BD
MESSDPLMFPISARSTAGVRANAARLAQWLSGPGRTAALEDIGYTLARRRSHLRERRVVLAADRAELTRGLQEIATGEPADGSTVEVFGGSVTEAADRGVVFVFSGQGSEWAGMGARLLEGEPAFAAVVEELDPVFRDEGRGSLPELLTGDDLATGGAALVQPAIFAMQVGLAAVWQDHGVRPAAVIGQSMGELAAAAVSGGLPLADAARVICRRSELMERRLHGQGSTALVELPVEEVERLVADRPGLEIAVYTSSRSTVVAGDQAEVAALVSYCDERGLAAYPIESVRMAAHSRLVDPILEELTEALSGLAPGTPSVDFYSTVLTDPRSRPAFDAHYWADNLRRPVRFSHAILAAAADGRRAFAEMSPHPLLVRPIGDTLGDSGTSDAVVTETMRRAQPARASLLRGLARLSCHGVPLDWRRQYPAGRLAELPTTAWRHQEFSPVAVPTATGPPDVHPLLGTHLLLPGAPERHVWQTEIDPERLGWLTDHKLADTVVLPGTAYGEIAVAAGCTAFETRPARVAVTGLEFRRILVLDRPITLTTTLTVEADGRAQVEIVTDAAGAAAVHATAHLHVEGTVPERTVSLGEVAAAHPVRREPASVYARLRDMGLRYGPAFTAITELSTAKTADDAEGSAFYRLARPDALPPDPRLNFHPALLDACLQGAAALWPEGDSGTIMPTAVGRLRVTGDLERASACRLRLSCHEGGYQANAEAFDEAGRLLAELDDVTLRRIDDEALPVSLNDLMYAVELEAAPLPAERAAQTGRWLLCRDPDDDDGFASGLADRLTEAGAPCATTDLNDGSEHLVGSDSDGPPQGIVLIGWTSQHNSAEATAADAERRVVAGVRLVTKVAPYQQAARRPRLFVVTRGATTGTPSDLGQGGLPGLVRTLRTEHPELRPTLVDIDHETDPADVAAELTADMPEDEVAWRKGVRHVARLTQLPTDRLPAPTRPLVRPGAGYAVTGGLRGLGLETARWLAGRGAGCLVLNGRSEPTEETRRAIAEIEASGAQVVVVRGDIAAPRVAEQLVRAVEERGMALRGVVHAAMVLDDALVINLDERRLRQVWSPKAAGAWRLHQATAGRDLDWWVGYSSLAAMIGSTGQANYAAANSYLDALARWRRAHGLPAQTISWAPWAEVGSAQDARIDGIAMLRPREGFAVLEELITRDCAQVGVVRLREDFAEVFPRARESSYLARMVTTAPDGGKTTGAYDRAALERLAPEELRHALADRVRHRICQVMGFKDDDLPTSRPLVHLGLDSVAAVKIRDAVREDFGLDLPVPRLLQGASALDVAAEIALMFGDGHAATGRRGAGAGDRAVRRARTRADRVAEQRTRRRRQR